MPACPPRALALGALPLLLLLAACTATHPYIARTTETDPDPPETPRAFRVFLLGDAGAAGTDAPVLRLLRRQLDAAGEDAAVVFLGDNLYGGALPDSGAAGRAAAEARLRPLLDAVAGFAGEVVFLPGERDWRDGPEGVRRQQAFIEAVLGRDDVFLPGGALPGPVEVKLTDDFRLVALDTAWWLTDGARPYGDVGDYEVEEPADVLLALDDLLRRRDDETVLVVGHHLVRSEGVRGGRFPLRTHLFPLTEAAPWLYVPLPAVGSLYPLLTRFAGRSPQDLAHPRYRVLREALLQTFTVHERLIYASAHEQNLQFRNADALEDPARLLVSGSAGTTAPVLRGGDNAFAYAGLGLAVLDFFEDGTLDLTFLRPGDGGRAEVLLHTRAFGPSRDLIDPQAPPATAGALPTYAGETVTRAVNPAYDAGALHRFFLGHEHRDAWATPVTVPVLDLGTFAGGLTLDKRGGGQQTLSLRFENPEGYEYVVRSIDKDPSRTVPVNLQGTVATDIIQDQIASIHPFGAFIIPPLAGAAGLYHTNPRLVYVPDDPRLGRYRDAFGDQIMMIEERPDDDMSAFPSFGGSDEVISAGSLYDEVNGDNDHRVDQPFFLRNRLFDLLLSDWDRHRDQWRWAAFEPFELDSTLEGDARTQGKIYRAIPRDRDFAFNRLDGVFPSLAGYFDPKFQDFRESYGLLRGLTNNGLEQDRRFLNAMTREDFVATARDLQARLSDAVIDSALARWPEPIQDLDAAEFRHLLRVRRDQLPEVAEDFYELLAGVVDVVGSNKHERFEVTRLDDRTTEVVVYKTSKEGDVRKEIYRRTFFHDETREVRLYGLAGNDAFVVTGEAQRGLRVRAVGGPGEDTFVDRSRVGGPRAMTRFYDTRTGTDVEAGPETRVRRSDADPAVNRYDPGGFAYDVRRPVAFFGYNEDDGVFLGGGVTLVDYGFRKQPYAALHTVKANLAARTLAANAIYEGHYVKLLDPWDVTLLAEYRAPSTIRNFYGLGNETEDTDRDAEFFQARLTQATLAPGVLRATPGGAGVRFGPRLQITDVREEDDRFIGQPQAGISPNTFDTQVFASLDAAFDVDLVDDAINPRQGFRWTAGGSLNVGVLHASDTFGRLGTDFTFYLSPFYRPQLTLAARAGVAHNVGDFPFYEANTLGGKNNLRGYRSTRFAGRTSVYQNAEARLELFTYSTYLAIGRAGVLAFLDNGRVFIEDDPSAPGGTSSRWHQGYGGGLWTEVFDLFVLTGTAGFSEDGTHLTVGLGFQY
ncbi:MAG: BamA/TamA family outer membrane protein [Rhodothermales bacterium]|nr:BamA/TamA family outer membrane protein [Rhodothermales bacterium]